MTTTGVNGAKIGNVLSIYIFSTKSIESPARIISYCRFSWIEIFVDQVKQEKKNMTKTGVDEAKRKGDDALSIFHKMDRKPRQIKSGYE